MTKKLDDVTLFLRTSQFVLLIPHNGLEGLTVLIPVASLISSFPNTLLLTHPVLASLFLLFLKHWPPPVSGPLHMLFLH